MKKNHRESLCYLTVIVIPPNQAEEGWSLINTYFRHVPGESQISVIMSALYIGMVQILRIKYERGETAPDYVDCRKQHFVVGNKRKKTIIPYTLACLRKKTLEKFLSITI